MRVLLVCGTYTNGIKIVSKDFVHHQAIELKKRGIDIAILSLDMRSIRRKRKLGINEYVIDGIPIYVAAFPCGPVKGMLEFVSQKMAAIAYKRVIKKWGKPDIIHGHFSGNSYAVMQIAKKNNIPLITTEHGTNILNINRKSDTEKKAYAVYKNSDRVICVSTALKNAVSEFYNGKVDIIPNILSSNFKLISTEKSKEFTFITVSNLVPHKNVDLVIKAFAKFIQAVPNARLIIAGDGSEMPKLTQLAKDLNVLEKVEFKGRVENSLLPHMYNSAHCFVLPSKYETFGVVYIEAMACGLPVITTSNTAENGIVNSGNGIAVESYTEDNVLKAMKYVYDNYENYSPNEISEECINKYCADIVSKQIMEVYGEALDNG